MTNPSPIILPLSQWRRHSHTESICSIPHHFTSKVVLPVVQNPGHTHTSHYRGIGSFYANEISKQLHPMSTLAQQSSDIISLCVSRLATRINLYVTLPDTCQESFNHLTSVKLYKVSATPIFIHHHSSIYGLMLT